MWIKKIFIVVLISTLYGCKHWEPLTPAELDRQIIYTTLTLVDWRQTQKIGAGEYVEFNPILGEYPSRDKIDTLIPLGILTQWGMTYYLPHKYRKTWQYFVIGAETTAVANNYSIGIRVDF